jgi:5-methylcytosine-specific restriction protein A
MKEGRLTTTMVVHHKIAHKGDPKLFFDWANLEALCKSHHDAHTARDDGGFGNKIK